MIGELLRIYNLSRTNAGKPECTFAETLIFNEGWLLRGVLKHWQSWTQLARFSFLPFPEGVKVYSEAQLYTPFKARFRGTSWPKHTPTWMGLSDISRSQPQSQELR